MSFVARIREANNACLGEYVPLFAGGEMVGLLWRELLDTVRASGVDVSLTGKRCVWHTPGGFAENKHCA